MSTWVNQYLGRLPEIRTAGMASDIDTAHILMDCIESVQGFVYQAGVYPWLSNSKDDLKYHWYLGTVASSSLKSAGLGQM